LSAGRGGGVTVVGVGEENCAGRGDDAQDGRRQGGRQRRSPGGRRRGGEAPEAGEDVAEEEDGMAEAEPRRPGQVREEAAAFWGLTVADQRRGGGVSGFGRPAAAENLMGQRTGGAAEGGSRGG
jgi:hypothetical protein